jgi:hypothetical protein
MRFAVTPVSVPRLFAWQKGSVFQTNAVQVAAPLRSAHFGFAPLSLY